jgi:hypothetical protein
MTFGECWSERAEMARGPAPGEKGQRQTPRYKALSKRIRELVPPRYPNPFKDRES